MLQMNRKTKIAGGSLILLVTGLIASREFLTQPSLQELEQRCAQTADAAKREAIAMKAVKLLLRQDVPDTLAQYVQKQVDEETISSLQDEFFADTCQALNDSLAALFEAQLADFFPTIFQLRKSTNSKLADDRLRMAEVISQKVDLWMKCNYWTPLLRFLAEADSATWGRWRAAAICAGLSRKAYYAPKYELAKLYAIHGLVSLAHIPDRRLQLDLQLRLQNAIAEGDAIFSLSLALGERITKACLEARHYLRAACMDISLANQMIRTGRNDAAIEKLNNVRNLAERWRWCRDMKYYRLNVLERLAVTMHKIGEYQTMLHYLDLFGKSATSPREKALYHIGQGEAAEALGDYQNAEREYLQAVEIAKENDPANAWYAYLHLAKLFLNYELPDKSLNYLDKAISYGRQQDILSNEKSSAFLFLLAQTQIQNQALAQSQETLQEAERLSYLVDSPRLSVENLMTAAEQYITLGKLDQAASRLTQAREICRKNDFFIQEIETILMQSELSLRTAGGASRFEYPANELSNVIGRLSKINEKPLLIRALALIIDAAYRAGRVEDARLHAQLLLEQTEALSQRYDEEERLIFFQHGIYKDIKSAIQLDLKLGNDESAFLKLNYIKGRALRRRLAGSANSTLDIASLKTSLQNDEALIDYMISDDTLYAFVLTRSDLRIFPMAAGRSTLQTKVNDYLRALKDDEAFDADYDDEKQKEQFLTIVDLSNDLYHRLIGKIAEPLRDINRIYIVPDEFLHTVPFSTLATEGRKSPRFLVQDKAIMMLPGAWLLADSSGKREMMTDSKLLASIAPDMFGADKIVERLADLFGENVNIHTKWEDAHAFRTSLAGDYPLYLFYAHGEADWENPRKSYIQFPLDKAPRTDRLFYQDVDMLDWRKAKLIILAGCETTGSRIYLGAGLSGLQCAFLAGGANQVLATYWKVDAAQVAEQIPRFLEVWKRDHDAMRALQQMQTEAIAQLKSDPYYKYPHPRLWGAYSLTGIKSESGGEDDSLVNLATK